MADSLPQTRDHAQLHAHLQQLEARLAEVTGCLDAAETRGAELLSTQAYVQTLEAELHRLQRKLAAVEDSRSWRMTAPLRTGLRRVRDLLRDRARRPSA
ncbi:MAG: hypothetical protein ACR2OB_05275 [Solirubrobacteraceae bacterium]